LGISNQCGVNMAFIGNTVTTQGFTPAIDYFNGDGTTTAFTLSRPVASVAQVQVVVNNVPQLPGTAYTVSGSTITFTGAPSSGTSNIYVYYTSPITQVIQPGQGTVSSTSFASSTGSGAVVLQTSPTVTTPTITDYIESVVAIGTVTSSSTISLTSGTVQTATLTASTACTFTMPTATAGKSFVLLLKQAASTGNGTATFTSVKWGTAGAPTITATAGKMDILTFIADGTNWYGSYVQGYTP
jgi:hypothetical protein